MRNITIIPSIASADPLNIMYEMDRLNGTGKLHLDIEDGNFVPNITFGIKTVRRIAEYTAGKMELDVHLLVNNPNTWIDDLAECGITKIAFHPDAVHYPLEILRHIHQRGLKAGFALDFSSPASVLCPFLSGLDYVIVMTAEPDGQGMLFNPLLLEKIHQVRQLLGDNREVWADGGIGADTVFPVANAGASVIILGRAIFSAGDPKQRIMELSAICN